MSTLWAPPRSQANSLTFSKAIRVSYFKLIQPFISVFLLSERLLWTLAFPFGRDKDLTTFDKNLYFLSQVKDKNVKTMDQKMSIQHTLPVFGSFIQFLSISSNWYCLHSSFTIQTSLSKIKCRMTNVRLPMPSKNQSQDLNRGEIQVISFNIIELRRRFCANIIWLKHTNLSLTYTQLFFDYLWTVEDNSQLLCQNQFF